MFQRFKKFNDLISIFFLLNNNDVISWHIFCFRVNHYCYEIKIKFPQQQILIYLNKGKSYTYTHKQSSMHLAIFEQEIGDFLLAKSCLFTIFCHNT